MNESVGYGKNTFKVILNAIKERILLIIIIVCLFTGAGVFYATNADVNYSASQSVNYMVRNRDSNNIQANINNMRAYIDTMIDFCDEDIIVSRANYIYNEYKKYSAYVDKTIPQEERTFNKLDQFIVNFNNFVNEDANYSLLESQYLSQDKTFASFIENEYIDNAVWNLDAEISREIQADFVRGSITASAYQKTYDKNSSFVFAISYKDDLPSIAKEKLRILVLAIRVEAFDAFGGIITQLKETVSSVNQLGASADFSKKTCVVIFGAVGVAAALVVVYLINVLNNNISSKEEVERITESNVLSCIERVEG